MLAEMARVSTARQPRQTRAWLPLAAALVLASISGAWVARSLPPSRSAQLHPAGFVAVPGAGGLPPMESGAIVRVALQIARAAVVRDSARVRTCSTDSVDADLLVAQDGLHPRRSDSSTLAQLKEHTMKRAVDHRHRARSRRILPAVAGAQEGAVVATAGRKANHRAGGGRRRQADRRRRRNPGDARGAPTRPSRSTRPSRCSATATGSTGAR